MSMNESGAVFVGLGLFLLVFYVAILAVAVVMYIVGAKGMYTIAKRRNISNPWLAWVPVGSAWLLGSISDQYQSLVKNKTTNRRKWLLILDIIAVAFGSVCSAVSSVISIATIHADTSGAQVAGLIGAVVLLLLAMLAMGLAIASAIITYFAYYDLFVSAKPQKAVLYLVLGIVISVTLPFFVYGCRNSDEGMPQNPICIEE